jgi:hypothetical protein
MVLPRCYNGVTVVLPMASNRNTDRTCRILNTCHVRDVLQVCCRGFTGVLQ